MAVPAALCVVTTTRGLELGEGMARVVGTTVLGVLEGIQEAGRKDLIGQW